MLEIENVVTSFQSSKEPVDSFPRIKYPITYNEFFNEHLVPNKPCLFSNWLTEDWKARKEWVTSFGGINTEFLSRRFGTVDVPVADCNDKHFDSQKKITFILKDYLYYIEKEKSESEKKCLYLKDWHFVKSFPDYSAYTPPYYFASDWLNEFWELRKDIDDDYRFVYLGPKGTWTPFHADVFRSYSWSANICGRKRWIFYPPEEYTKLQDKFGSLIYDVESPEARDQSLYPNFKFSSNRLEIIQEEGETIFVPSNWYHQVWNLEDTLSINHNWINGTNIIAVWEFLLKSLKEVQESISDCREMKDWTQQCQMILKATHGMDFKEYFTFMEVIARRRIEFLEGKCELKSFGKWLLGKRHAIFDCQKLIKCLELFLDAMEPEILATLGEENHPSFILDELQTVI